jgi:nitroimidazol reductase NimA-like FMN-containing flavoprotein (pyridoxamine 5'-phosphate oxidase superfamily)
MRTNPKVCLERDEVVSPYEWTSVVAFGEYEELPDTPERADERQFRNWDRRRRLIGG